MLKKLKDILNTYTDKELEELDFWVNSNDEIKAIIVDEYNIDLITRYNKIDIIEETEEKRYEKQDN